MNIRSFKLALIAFFFCLAPHAFSGERGWTQLSNGLAVEKISVIEPSELWHAVQGNIYRSSDGLVVGFWPIDSESAKRKDGWILVGFALFGLGDVAEKPVAVRLWSQKALVFSETESADYEKRHGRVSLFFRSSHCADRTDQCVRELVAVVPKLSGTSEVSINNRNFGTIR